MTSQIETLLTERKRERLQEGEMSPGVCSSFARVLNMKCRTCHMWLQTKSTVILLAAVKQSTGLSQHFTHAVIKNFSSHNSVKEMNTVENKFLNHHFPLDMNC